MSEGATEARGTAPARDAVAALAVAFALAPGALALWRFVVAGERAPSAASGPFAWAAALRATAAGTAGLALCALVLLRSIARGRPERAARVLELCVAVASLLALVQGWFAS